jgi:hypothetical protein
MLVIMNKLNGNIICIANSDKRLLIQFWLAYKEDIWSDNTMNLLSCHYFFVDSFDNSNRNKPTSIVYQSIKCHPRSTSVRRILSIRYDSDSNLLLIHRNLCYRIPFIGLNQLPLSSDWIWSNFFGFQRNSIAKIVCSGILIQF